MTTDRYLPSPSRIALSVVDLRLTERWFRARLGTAPLAAVQGERGARRAAARSPDGVVVEILEADPLARPAGAQRDCPAAVRYVTLSTPDLDASVAYLGALTGREPGGIALHAPEHEALWGLPGARCHSTVFDCGDVWIEVVQYLDPVGRPWPEGHRSSDQGIAEIAFGARNANDHAAVCGRARSFGARPDDAPLQLPDAGAVQFSDALGFPVGVLWMDPARADRDWGFEPRPIDQRAPADDRQVSGTASIEAPLERVWSVLNDHEGMTRWTGFRVQRRRAGDADPDGYGAERLMRGLPGTIVEQVIAVEPMRRIRYRVVEGGPLIFHNGELRLEPLGATTEVTWTIRFRSGLPLLGPLLQLVMKGFVLKLLKLGLKPHVERLAAGGR